MFRKNSEFARLGLTALSLPFISGCLGGAGGSLSSFLFGDVLAFGEGGESLGLFSGGSSEILASVHSPEPATMLLVSGGITAFALMRSRNKK